MKKHLLTKTFLFLAFLFCTYLGWGQNIWTGTAGDGLWTSSTNWSLGVPGSTDIVQFNSNATVTAVPASVGIYKLILTNNAQVSLSASAASVMTITGASGIDLDIPFGCKLTLGGTFAISLTISTGATGSVSGSIICTGAAHKILPSDANALTFNSGAILTQDTGCSGNIFSNSGTANVVIFASGSLFIQNEGSDPNGLTQPSTRVTFQTGSTFKLQQNYMYLFYGRTYSNFEINSTAFNQTNIQEVNVTVDNLTITLDAANTANFNGTGNITINGNLTINSGNVGFNPPSPTGTTAISGNIIVNGGTLSFNPTGTISGTTIVNGKVTLNSGTMNINPDGNAISIFTIKGGIEVASGATLNHKATSSNHTNLNISGDILNYGTIDINPVTGIYSYIFLNGGTTQTLTSSGSFSTGSPKARLIVVNGTKLTLNNNITSNGDFYLLGALDAKVNVISGTGAFRYLASQSLSLTGNTTLGSTTITNITTTFIQVGMSITGTGIPANTYVTYAGGTQITISQAATATNTGVTLTISNEGLLYTSHASGVNGNITTSTKVINTGTSYCFYGSIAQVTGSLMPATVKNLSVDKTIWGVDLSSPVTVSNNLILTNGVIGTTTTNTLLINNTSPSAITKVGGYVYGPLDWKITGTGTENFLFPIADSWGYNFKYLVLGNLIATDVVIRAQAFYSGALTVDGTTLTTIYPRYWSLTNMNAGTFTSATITLYENGLNTVNKNLIGKSSVSSGNYSSIGGTLGSGFITSDVQTTLPAFLAIGTKASNASDIVTSNNEVSNIDYSSKTASLITTTTDGIKVWSFTIRDGGATSPDDDENPTKINFLAIVAGTNNIATWASTLKRAALFDGSTLVKEIEVNDIYLIFNLSSSPLTIDDNSTKTLDLYLTFETTNIIDNSALQFKIADENIATGEGSTFTDFIATSSIAGDNNKIEVTASKFIFNQQPPATIEVHDAMTVKVEAVDANNMRDIDFVEDIKMTSTGTFESSTTTVTPVEGLATFDNLIFAAIASDITVTAMKNADNTWPINSNIFDVTAVPSSENDIMSYTVEGIDGTIDAGLHTVTVEVLYSTSLTALIATFELSPYASATVGATPQVSETTDNDFTAPVVYTVTAEDGTPQDWTVTITNAPASDDATLSDLTVGGTTVTGFAPTTFTYNVVLPYGTTAVPTVVAVENNTFANAVVTQALNVTGTLAERTTTVDVTAEDLTSTEVYTIVFSVAPETGILIFSEIIEGTGSNRAFEIYNPNATAVDLSQYTVKQSHDGTGFGVDGIAYVLPLEGTIAANDVYVIANNGAVAGVLAVADTILVYSTSQGQIMASFTGDDGLGLFRNGVLVDVIGQESIGPWDVAGTAAATVDHTLIRKFGTTVGNTNWTASAGTDVTSSEWIVEVLDYITNIGLPTEEPNEAPVITGVTLDPTNPTAFDDVIVSATITDDNTAAVDIEAYLYWGIVDGEEDTELDFLQVDFTDVFSATIPESTASTIYYVIEAFDGELYSEEYGSYSITVGINNPDAIVTMNVFPNPSNGQFALEMNAQKAGTFNVEIVNISGQVVFEKQIVQDGIFKSAIDISNSAKGVYYIRINDGTSVNVQKIVIQ